MKNTPVGEPMAEETARVPLLTGVGLICAILGIPAFLCGGTFYATAHAPNKTLLTIMTLIPSALAVTFSILGRRREPAQRGLASIGIILGGSFLLFGACLLLFPYL